MIADHRKCVHTLDILLEKYGFPHSHGPALLGLKFKPSADIALHVILACLSEQGRSFATLAK